MKHLLVLAILVGTARAETRVSVRWGNVAGAREAALVRLHGVEDATIDNVGINVHSDAANVYATLTLASLALSVNAEPLLTMMMGLVVILTLLSIGFYLREWVRHMNSAEA